MACMHIVKLLRCHIYCNKAASLINAPLPFLWEKGYQIAIQIGFKTLKFSQDIEIFVYLPTFYLENVILGPELQRQRAYIRINTVILYYGTCNYCGCAKF